MPNPNDTIIQRVFEASLEWLGAGSAEYTFYHSLQSSGLPVDNRMLANFLIQNFPWPIGVELRRLFSGDRRQRDKNRLEQVLKVGERAAQFYAYCLLVQLWDECMQREIELTADFNAQIRHFDRPSFGIFAGLIRAVPEVFGRNRVEPFFDLGKNSGKKHEQLLQVIGELVQKRNADRHLKEALDCESAEELLTELLVQLSFLVKYKLVTIKEIKVICPKLKQARFHHTMRMLNSQHEDFSAMEKFYDEYAESHSVLLMKDFVNPKQYLNLSPLIIDTSAILGNERAPGIKNGIYLFAEQRKDKYLYALTSAPEQAAMNALPDFEDLAAQFDDLKKCLRI